MDTATLSFFLSYRNHKSFKNIRNHMDKMLNEYAAMEYTYHYYPGTALKSIRTFAELLTKSICILEQKKFLLYKDQSKRNEYLRDTKIIDHEQFLQLEDIRTSGNKEMHGDEIRTHVSKEASMATHLFYWFLYKYTSDVMISMFIVPPKKDSTYESRSI